MLPIAIGMLRGEDGGQRASSHHRRLRFQQVRIIGRPIEQVAQREIPNGGIRGIRLTQPGERIAPHTCPP
jgi:hypothetical protein